MENKYTHVERLTSTECEGILNGNCYFYPKLDGANASIEMDSEGNILARSRKRILSETENLKGFYQYVQARKPALKAFFNTYPHIIIFGEWLIPHSLKCYVQDAWNNFYAFDFFDKHSQTYLNFEKYKSIVTMDYNIDIRYVPLLCKIANPTQENIDKALKQPYPILEWGYGEGIVIKNYEFINKFGRPAFAKIIHEHLQAKKSSKPSDQKSVNDFEKKLVYKYLSEEYVLKELNKLEGNTQIGKLIHIVFEEFVRDYISEINKKYKCPTINFRVLKKNIASVVADIVLR